MSKPNKENFHTQAGFFFFSTMPIFQGTLKEVTPCCSLWFSVENDLGCEAWWAAWLWCSDFQIPPSFLRDCTAPEQMAPQSSILSWRIPWTEEPGGLLSMGVTKGQTQLQWLSMLSRWNTYTKRVGSYRNFQIPMPLSWQISAKSALPSFLETQRENQPHRPNFSSRFLSAGKTELASPQN